MPFVESGPERERFEELFSEHFEAVLAYAMARADPETADDAVAETFVVAWRRFGEVPDQPRAWLLAVTRRTLATQRRAHSRQDALAQKMARPRPLETAPDAWIEDPTSPSLAARNALDRISEADRELLCLLAWDGLSQREAAAVLGCSTGAFRVRYLRARRRFRSALDEESRGAITGSRRCPSHTNNAEERTA
jgi:RNA polymerase sigma-70 factor (ECF subfamily)